MAAYAVIARIGRVEPHLTLRDLDFGEDEADLGDRMSDDTTVTVADVGAPDAGRFTERLIRLRELWAQTTFYLSDPEGWR